MNATDLIQFTAKTLGMGIVLIGLAPFILVAWLCYFLGSEVEETAKTSYGTKQVDIQTKRGTMTMASVAVVLAFSLEPMAASSLPFLVIHLRMFLAALSPEPAMSMAMDLMI